MRPLASRARALAAAALLVPAAACDGDGGGTSVDRLTPREVAGVYQVCTLRFTPSQAALPVADLLQRIIDPTPPAGKLPPTVTLSGSVPQYQLVYTRTSDAFSQDQRGSVSFGERTVNLSLGSETGSEIVREALLPSNLQLTFNAGAGTLTTTGTSLYSVRRADYARAAGITQEGLQERINGKLTATLQEGGC